MALSDRPEDDKADDALRTIGETSRLLGIKPHILRYWEEQFRELKPLTRAGKRRYYRANDIALLREIDRLLNIQKYTMKGARAALKGWKPGGQPAGVAPPAPEPEAPPPPADLPDDLPLISAIARAGGSVPRQLPGAIAERLRAVRNDLAEALEQAD